MIVLQIIGIILAVVVILFALILLIPVSIIIDAADNQDVSIYFKVLFLKFGAKNDEKPKKKNKFAEAFRKLIGAPKSRKTKSKKSTTYKKVDATSMSDKISSIIEIVKQVAWVFKYCTLKKLMVSFVSATGDAGKTAIDYGVACAAIYPITGYLYSIMKVKDRGVDLDIRCDFESDCSHFDFKAQISVRVFYILCAFMRLIKEETHKKLQQESS